MDPELLAKSGEAAKSGPIGLAVILILCIGCYFLFKSMSKHLKTVREDFPADRGAELGSVAEPSSAEPFAAETAAGQPIAAQPIDPDVRHPVEPTLDQPPADPPAS
jgi:hypothetical protein